MGASAFVLVIEQLPSPPAAVDSGYTEDELDAIFATLMKTVVFSWPEEPLALALAIGLTDGDALALSERGTVMLTASRAEIERRVAAIKEKIADGMGLREAVAVVVG